MTNKTVLSNEQIGKALHDAGILDLECVALRYDLDVARATEQAVLQSPEIQQLRKDAERWEKIAKSIHSIYRTHGADSDNRIKRLVIDVRRNKLSPPLWLADAVDDFDAAMEAKP